MNTPIAKRKVTNIIFGKEENKNKGNNHFLMEPKLKKDYYYWLRDDTRQNKEILSYIEEENDYGDDFFVKNNLLKLKLINFFKRNLVENYETYKLPMGKEGFKSTYRFYKKFVKGKSQPIFMYSLNNISSPYLEINENTELLEPIFAPDLSIFGYGLDKIGNEKYHIILKTFPQLKEIDHEIPPLLYGYFIILFKKIYYVESNECNRMYRLIEYDINTKEKIIIYEEKKIDREIEIELCDDKILVKISSHNENEVRIINNGFFLVEKMKRGVNYNVKIIDDYLFLLKHCDRDNVKYKKIGEDWQEFDAGGDYMIEQIEVCGKALLMLCRKKGEQFLKYKKIGENPIILGKKCGGYFLEFIYGDNNKFIYSYQSFLTPRTFYQVDTNTMLEESVWSMKGIDTTKYKSIRRLVAVGNVEVPIDMVMRNDYKTGRCLMYGYGAYGMNSEIKYDEKIFGLLDEGFMYVVVNVRGSSYMGRKFYEDGKMKRKMNSFRDFIGVGEYLIREGYCEKGGLSIEGRSAGGLLVAASAVMRPDLFRNVIALVPFVDVLVTMSDGSIPLTGMEWKEWGNSNYLGYYNLMSKYSPVDNIREGVRYPNFYVTGGLNDGRVGYWEPLKLVANLRRVGGSKVVLRVNMGGHFTSRNRYKYLEEVAEKYVFLIKN